MKGKSELQWYEMAIKFESLYQDEVIAHESAVTNLSCYKIEAEEQLRQAAEVEQDLRDELSRSNHNLEDGLKIMKNLEEEIMQAQDQLSDMRMKLEEKQSVIDQLEDELDGMKHNVTRAETSAKKAKAEANTVSKDNENLHRTIRGLQIDLEDKTALCKKLENQLVVSREDQKRLTGQIKLYENKEKQWAKEKEEDHQNLLSAREEISALETKIAEMESEHQATVAQIEADYLHDIDERCAEIVSLQNELSQYQVETPKLKTELEAYKAEVDHFRKQSRHLNNDQYLSKLSIAEKKLQALEGNEIKLKASEKLVDDFRTQNLTLQDKLRSVISDSAREQQQWVVMEKKHRADIQVLQDQLTASQSTNRDLNNKCSSLEQTIKELQTLSPKKSTVMDSEGGSKVLSDSVALKKFMRDRKRQ